jgi:AraC-like DNA-binding protein
MKMGRGDMALIDLSCPEAHLSTDSHTMLLAIPRTRAERAGIDVRAMHGVIVAPRANQMVRRHLIELCRIAPHLAPAQASALENATMDLLSVMLAMAGIGGTPSSRAVETVKKQAVLEMIAHDLGASDLGVAKLMEATGISRTALYRLFELEGGVQAYIRQQRLMRVRRELNDAPPGERIADIANRWGFDDAAHFSRLFRRQFGTTPSKYRNTERPTW